MLNNVKAKSKEPLVLIEKRAELGPRQSLMVRLGSVLLALFAAGLFMLAIGYNPFELYGTIASGAFRSAMAFQATIKIMIPLLISALGVTLAFKMKFWNIGGEGQIIMGAVDTFHDNQRTDCAGDFLCGIAMAVITVVRKIPGNLKTAQDFKEKAFVIDISTRHRHACRGLFIRGEEEVIHME
jgi:ABC-type uncharacterized transport system permease subunit